MMSVSQRLQIIAATVGGFAASAVVFLSTPGMRI